MSRYTIDSTKPGIEIVVGWDPPLRSLFAQVSDCTITNDEADPMLLWEDFGSIDALASAIAPWATLQDDIRQSLAVESGEKPARRPPAFERPESVVFSGQRCRVLQAVYPHGGIALQLFTDDNIRAPFATATVCIPAYAIRENSQTALVKDYEENAGMLEAGRRVKSGFVELHVVDVLRAGEARS